MGAGALRRGGVRGAIAAALVVLLLLALPAVGRGADTFVDDDTGSNANACTSSGAPCFTIGGGTGGIAKAGTNDTVRVDGGTYNEVLTLSNGKSLIEQNFNTGAGDSQARIDGGAAVAITVPLGGSAGTIDGFDLTSDVTVVLLQGPGTITDNAFADSDPADATLLILESGSAASTVTGNTFTDTAGGMDSQTGVNSGSSGSPSIAGNTFQSLNAGIRLATGSPTVSGNTITGTRKGAASAAGQAIVVFADATASVVGNDINSPEPGDNVFGVVVNEATATMAPTARPCGETRSTTTRPASASPTQPARSPRTAT